MKFDDAVEVLVNIFTKSHREQANGSEEKTAAILEDINYTLLASVLYSFFHVLLTADEMKEKVKTFISDRYGGNMNKLWESCNATLKKYKQRSESGKVVGGVPLDEKTTTAPPLKRGADGVPVPVTAFLNSQDPTSPTLAVGAGANGAPFSPLNGDGGNAGVVMNELTNAIDTGASTGSMTDTDKMDAILDEGAHWYELHLYIKEFQKKLGGSNERSSSTVAQLRKRLYHLRYEHPLKTEVIYNLLNLMLSQTNSEIFKAPLDPKTTMEYNKITAGPYDQVVFHGNSIANIKENVAASANQHYHSSSNSHVGKHPGVAELFATAGTKRPRVEDDTTLHTVLYNYTSSINRVITIADLERCIYHISANCCFFNAPESFFPRCARGFAENCVFHLAQYCREQLLL